MRFLVYFCNIFTKIGGGGKQKRIENITLIIMRLQKRKQTIQIYKQIQVSRSYNTNLTASDQLLFVHTCLPIATLILFELLTTAPVNALYYIENFQGHKTENAFI